MRHHRRRRRRHGPKIAAADSTAAARAKTAKPKPSLSAETEFRLCFVFCPSFTLVVEEKTFFLLLFLLPKHKIWQKTIKIHAPALPAISSAQRGVLIVGSTRGLGRPRLPVFLIGLGCLWLQSTASHQHGNVASASAAFTLVSSCLGLLVLPFGPGACQNV